MPIKILKIGIMLAILVVFYVTFVLPMFYSSNKRLRIVNEDKNSNEITPGKTYIAKPYFKGKDSKGRLYIIKAEEGRGEKQMLLEGVKAEMELQDGKMFLKSNTGEIEQDSEVIKLTGDVELYDNKGFVAKTAEAVANYKNKSAVGNKPITISHPKGTITSNSFEVLPEGNIFIFKSKVKVRVD